MSLYVAEVGEVIIRPEYRRDMGHFVRGEYDEVSGGELAEFIYKWAVMRDKSWAFPEIKYWSHNEYKDEWKGKYKTCYNEETGRFVYGKSYNLHTSGFSTIALREFFELLRKMTQEVIFKDGYAED